MPSKLSLQEIKSRLAIVHCNRVSIKENTYVNTKTKCIFIDIEFGEWAACPSNILKGRGHPDRKFAKMRAWVASKKVTVEQLNKRLAFVHQNKVTVVSDTFKGMRTKCSFIDDEFGIWEAFPLHIVRGVAHPTRAFQNQQLRSLERYGVAFPLQSSKIRAQAKQTSRQKYGHDNPMSCHEIQLKSLKGMSTIVKHHWKTSIELFCVGSYEVAVVEWLNTNRYDYEWQPGPFTMPDGRTYRLDVLIVTGPFANTWVEIKGYFRDDAKEKWEWFHSVNPSNSQLWDSKKLKEIGILSSK